MTTSFDPGLDRAAKDGVKVSRAPYPGGNEGIRISIEKVCLKVAEARFDPAVKGWGIDVMRKHGLDGRAGAKKSDIMAAVLDELRGATVYIDDARGAEVIQSAAATLCLRPGLCVRGGDCDDLVVALAGTLLSLGMKVWILKQSWARAAQEHVLVAAEDDSGNKVRMDPSSRLPAGSSYPAEQEVFYDPMEVTGAGAEIVTLGRIGSADVLLGLGRGGGGHGGGHGGGGHGAGGGGFRRGVHHQFRDGSWWGWGSDGWVVVTGGACTSWGVPETSPSPGLLAFARAQLRSSGGNPVATDFNGTTYLFQLAQSGGTGRTLTANIEIRPCVSGLSGAPKGGEGLGYTTGQQIEAHMWSTNGAMISADTAVQSNKQYMQATDVQQWNGIMVAYVKWFASLQDCYASWAPGVMTKCVGFYNSLSGWDEAGAQLDTYDKTAAQWQGVVAAANKAYKPPPPPPINPAGGGGKPSLSDQVATAAKAVGVTGLVLAGAYAIYKVVEVSGTFAEAHAIASKRAAAQDNPVKRLCPSGSEIQSLIFPASWGDARAARWATKHRFRAAKVDRTANTVRIRQHDPSLYRRIRTIPLGDGVRATVGWRRC